LKRSWAWIAIGLLWVGGAARAATPAAITSPPLVAGASLFTLDDQMLFSVESGNIALTDSLGAYASRSGLYLPLGELGRLLDLAIVVDPPQRRAEGWFLSDKRRLVVDLNERRAQSDGRSFSLGDADAVLFEDDIYVSAALLEKLLPLTLKVDNSALDITISTREPFPFQERAERERRQSHLGGGPSQEAVLTPIDTPYEFFTPPSVDTTIALSANRPGGAEAKSWEARVAGDLLWSGMRLYASSDDRGALASARVQFERSDPDAAIGGPLHLTRATFGDTYTPALMIGAQSRSGRGFTLTNAPLEQVSVFDKIDLRGELPVGYSVELYVNEVLRSSQSTPTQGQYEFLQIPLAFGSNVIRLVFYGPHGERREETKRLNAGTGQLSQGQTVVNFGAVQFDRSVITIRPSAPGSIAPPPMAAPGAGQGSIAGTFAYGLTHDVTVGAGITDYTPQGMTVRRLLTTADVATSLAGMALRLDVGHDNTGGLGTSLSFGGRPWGVSVIGHHSEYRDGFADEIQPGALNSGDPTVRSSDLRLDFASRLLGTSRVPISIVMHRDQQASGDTLFDVNGHVTIPSRYVIVSDGLAYTQSSGPGLATTRSLDGNFDLSGSLRKTWQVRGSIAYSVRPAASIDSAGIAFDRRLGINTALRLGIDHGFGTAPSTTLQAGLTARVNVFDVALSGAYTTTGHVAQAQLTFSCGMVFDPYARRYRLARTGVASGGALALHSFVDTNGDGRWEPGERALPGLAMDTALVPAVADEDGHLLVTGLGNAARARLKIRTDSIDDPYLLPPSEGVVFKPRAGRVTVAEFPLQASGEVMIKVQIEDAGGKARGVSALGVELVSAAGAVVKAGRSEYDGSLLLEGLPPGDYELRLDAQQSDRLKIRLVDNVSVHIPTSGGYVGEISAKIVVER